jgi:hypothetical protein
MIGDVLSGGGGGSEADEERLRPDNRDPMLVFLDGS